MGRNIEVGQPVKRLKDLKVSRPDDNDVSLGGGLPVPSDVVTPLASLSPSLNVRYDNCDYKVDKLEIKTVSVRCDDKGC